MYTRRRAIIIIVHIFQTDKLVDKNSLSNNKRGRLISKIKISYYGMLQRLRFKLVRAFLYLTVASKNVNTSCFFPDEQDTLVCLQYLFYQ